MSLTEIAERLDGVDLATLDAVSAAAVLGDIRRLVTGGERLSASVHARLIELSRQDPAVDPERINARATNRSETAARRDRQRAETSAAAPAVADVVDRGDASIEHLDVLSAIARQLDQPQRDTLLQHPRLPALAAGSTPQQFRRDVADLARLVRADDGIERFEQQRSTNRFDCRLDRHTGMYRLDGWLDPERGAVFSGKLGTRVDELFHDTVPDGCPTDPVERQAFLRAHALCDLVDGAACHGQRGVVEMSIVVDIETLRRGCHERSLIEFGPDGAAVPVETLRRYLCLSETAQILLHDGVGLAMGRDRRVATRDQRRMARAMYPRCAIAGCEAPFEHCELHHVVWWRHGGRTDLDNLVPLCSRHHHAAHEGGWRLVLHPETRVLTVTFPDGSVEAMPPPRARRSGAPPPAPPDAAVPNDASSLFDEVVR